MSGCKRAGRNYRVPCLPLTGRPLQVLVEMCPVSGLAGWAFKSGLCLLVISCTFVRVSTRQHMLPYPLLAFRTTEKAGFEDAVG